MEQYGRPVTRLQSFVDYLLGEREPGTYASAVEPVYKNAGHGTQTSSLILTGIVLKIGVNGLPWLPDTNCTVIECCIIQELKELLGEGVFQNLVLSCGRNKANSPTYCIYLNLEALRTLEGELNGVQQKIGEEKSENRKIRLDVRLQSAFDKPGIPHWNQPIQPQPLVDPAALANPDWMTAYKNPVEHLRSFCNSVLDKDQYLVNFEPRYEVDPKTRFIIKEKPVGIVLRVTMRGQYDCFPSGNAAVVRFDVVQELRDWSGWDTCNRLLRSYGLARDQLSYFLYLTLDGLLEMEIPLDELQKKIAGEPLESRSQRMQARREQAFQDRAFAEEALKPLNEKMQNHPDKDFVEELRVMMIMITRFERAFGGDAGFMKAILEESPKFNKEKGLFDAEQRYQSFATFVMSNPRYQDDAFRIFAGSPEEKGKKFVKYSDYINQLIEDYPRLEDQYFYCGLRNIVNCVYACTLPPEKGS